MLSLNNHYRMTFVHCVYSCSNIIIYYCIWFHFFFSLSFSISLDWSLILMAFLYYRIYFFYKCEIKKMKRLQTTTKKKFEIEMKCCFSYGFLWLQHYNACRLFISYVKCLNVRKKWETFNGMVKVDLFFYFGSCFIAAFEHST